jgi:RHS repeat-associated protein
VAHDDDEFTQDDLDEFYKSYWTGLPAGAPRLVIRYVHRGRLGAASFVTDTDGQLIGRQEHYPYGAPLREEGDLVVSGFSGTPSTHGQDFGLHRMGARVYAPALARWLTPDPVFANDPTEAITSPMQAALYGYVGNSPLSFVDPSGTKGMSVDEATNFFWNVAGSTQQPRSIADGTESPTRQRLWAARARLDRIDPKNYGPDTTPIYKDLLPTGSVRSNYIAAAQNTGNTATENKTRWTLQSLLVNAALKDESILAKGGLMSTHAGSKAIHEVAFQLGGGRNTIGTLPWRVLSALDVPKWLGEKTGGKLIGWTIDCMNSPGGGSRCGQLPGGVEIGPVVGPALRTAVDAASYATDNLPTLPGKPETPRRDWPIAAE